MSVGEYVSTLLTVSAVTAVLGLLPSEERARRALTLVLSVAVLSAVALPLPALLSDLPDEYGAYLDRLDASTAEGDAYLKGETLAAVGEGIAAHLTSRYDVRAGALSVTVEGEVVDGTVILRRVKIYLSPAAATVDARSMTAYVKENTGALCEVIYLEE